MTTRTGRLIVAGLGVAALALIIIELAVGAASFGQPRLADPCAATAGPPGVGIQGAIQRFTRETLDGAACQLHTTREELVLSFVPGAGTNNIRWSKQRIDQALQVGLNRATHDFAGGGLVGDALAFALRQAVAPALESFLQQAK
jgi:hypothetical protein